MKGRGFTIIELIIAVAITVSLLAAGMPNYTKFLYQQDFNNRTASLAECVQKAQQAASSPSSQLDSYAYSAVIITPNRTDLQCETRTYTSGDTLATVITGPSITTSTIVIKDLIPSNLILNKAQASADRATGIGILFPVVQHGVPSGIYWNASSPVTLEASFGQGIEADIQLCDKTSCDGLKTTLTMSRLGIPIQIQ